MLQRTFNPVMVGSIPTRRMKFGRVQLETQDKEACRPHEENRPRLARRLSRGRVRKNAARGRL